MICSTQKLG